MKWNDKNIFLGLALLFTVILAFYITFFTPNPPGRAKIGWLFGTIVGIALLYKWLTGKRSKKKKK